MTDASTRLLAVDGNSLGHRAFHATRGDTARTEHHITVAVLNMIARIWHFGPYNGILVAFDDANNRRKAWYPEYKANREAHPPALKTALHQLREDCAAMGIVTAQTPGAEADDLLAAAADSCTNRDWRCDLLSSDRDLISLVGRHVRLLRPRSSFADLRVEDEHAVVEHYGIAPHQYLDVAALRGDPSDGLTGAHGIGVKTAARLVRDYGSIAGIYDALGDLPVATEAALREARDRVERNVLLMAPIPHLAIDVTACTHWRVEQTADQLAHWDEDAARHWRRTIDDALAPQPPTPPPPDEPNEWVPHRQDQAATVPMPSVQRPVSSMASSPALPQQPLF